MTRDEVESGLLLLMKRFDRIGFGRRGVLDSEEQVVAWREKLDDAARSESDAIIRNWLKRSVSVTVAEPLHYTRSEDVQALAVHLLTRWAAPGLVAELDALAAAGEFRNDDGQLSPALGQALEEARQPIHR